MRDPIPNTCYVCGNDDEDLKLTRYGSTVGQLPAEWQNVDVPVCAECRNPHTRADLRGAPAEEIAIHRERFEVHEIDPENCPFCGDPPDSTNYK